MESFIDQKCNELALDSLKRNAEIKQQISQELESGKKFERSNWHTTKRCLLFARRATGKKYSI